MPMQFGRPAVLHQPTPWHSPATAATPAPRPTTTAAWGCAAARTLQPARVAAPAAARRRTPGHRWRWQWRRLHRGWWWNSPDTQTCGAPPSPLQGAQRAQQAQHVRGKAGSAAGIPNPSLRAARRTLPHPTAGARCAGVTPRSADPATTPPLPARRHPAPQASRTAAAACGRGWSCTGEGGGLYSAEQRDRQHAAGLFPSPGLPSACVAGPVLGLGTHPHFRKGTWGRGYLEGSSRNSSMMPPVARDGSQPPLADGRPGVPTPLGAALPSALGRPPALMRMLVRAAGGARSRVARDCAGRSGGDA